MKSYFWGEKEGMGVVDHGRLSLFIYFGTAVFDIALVHYLFSCFLFGGGGNKIERLWPKYSLYIYIYIYILAVLDHHWCMRAFSSCSEWGYSLLWCVNFSLWWLLLLWSSGSQVLAQYLWLIRLSCLWHAGSSWTSDWTCVSCIGR